MIYNPDEEVALWRQWRTGDKAVLGPLMRRYDGQVNSWVNAHKSPAIPDTTLKMEAWKQVKKSLDTYDPNRGAKLSTHIGWGLRKGTRLIHNYADAARLPEQRSLMVGSFKAGTAHLTEKLGRPPSIAELYDYFASDRLLGSSKKGAFSMREISRLQREVRNEVIGENPELEDHVVNTEQDPKWDLAMNLVYQSLTPSDQKVFEHQTGYMGSPVLKNVAIARMVGVSPTTIGKKRKKFQGMMERVLQ